MTSMKFNGSYKGIIVSITLNDDEKLLIERLGAIMKHRKKSKLITVSTVVLTFVMVFCAAATEAYAAHGGYHSLGRGGHCNSYYTAIPAQYGNNSSYYYDELSELMYRDCRINYFSSAMPRTSEDKRLELICRAYNDNQISFFSTALQHCNVGSISIDALAEQIYYDGNISYFSEIAPYISEAKRNELANLAYNENRLDFFEILSGN